MGGAGGRARGWRCAGASSPPFFRHHPAFEAVGESVVDEATVQKDGDAKRRVREKYEEDPVMLMRAAELVAIEFRTIAEANDCWRDRKDGGD